MFAVQATVFQFTGSPVTLAEGYYYSFLHITSDNYLLIHHTYDYEYQNVLCVEGSTDYTQQYFKPQQLGEKCDAA